MADVRLLQTFGANPQTERGTAGKIDICEDGSSILSCSGKTVILRDARQLTKCDAYTDHLKNVNVARFSPSGGYVASGDENGLVRVWSPAHPEKILKKETPVLGGPIYDLAWDSESKRIVAGGNGGKGFQVKAFLFDTGSALGEMSGHQKPVTTVAVRPTKPTTCATGAQDFKVGFYKGPPFKFLKSVVEHTNFVQCVRYSWDGALLCSVGSDSAIHFFDAETGDAKTSFASDVHSGSIYGCAFSADSKQLLTVGGDKTCKLWDIETSKVISSISVGNNTEDMQVAVSWAKSGSIGPVSLSLGGDLNILDFASGSISTRIAAHLGEPSTVACDWSSDKKEIYVGDVTGAVTRYEDGVGAHVVGRSHSDKVTRIVAKKGKVYSAGFDDTIKSITGAEFKDTASIGSQVQALSSTTEKPELCAFVTETKAGIVRDGQILSSIDLKFHGQGAALSPKGDILIVGEKDLKNPQARVYSVSADGMTITPTDKALKELIAPPIAMAFSHDGKYLAIGDNLKEVSLWDATTFEPIVRHKWVFHSSTINAIAWSPDSKFILSGSNDSQAYIWNVDKHMKKLKIPFAHKTGVTGVDWVGPTTVVTCGADRCVRTWEVTLPV